MAMRSRLKKINQKSWVRTQCEMTFRCIPRFIEACKDRSSSKNIAKMSVSCRLCSKSLGNRQILRRHCHDVHRTDLDGKPIAFKSFPCPDTAGCSNKSFKRRTQLVAHMKAVHGDDPREAGESSKKARGPTYQSGAEPIRNPLLQDCRFNRSVDPAYTKRGDPLDSPMSLAQAYPQHNKKVSELEEAFDYSWLNSVETGLEAPITDTDYLLISGMNDDGDLVNGLEEQVGNQFFRDNLESMNLALHNESPIQLLNAIPALSNTNEFSIGNTDELPDDSCGTSAPFDQTMQGMASLVRTKNLELTQIDERMRLYLVEVERLGHDYDSMLKDTDDSVNVTLSKKPPISPLNAVSVPSYTTESGSENTHELSNENYGMNAPFDQAMHEVASFLRVKNLELNRINERLRLLEIERLRLLEIESLKLKRNGVIKDIAKLEGKLQAIIPNAKENVKENVSGTEV